MSGCQAVDSIASDRARRRHGAAMVMAVLAAMCAAGAGTARGHDFRLYSGKVEDDGFTRDFSYFQNADRTRVRIGLPVGWAVAADPASLSLTSEVSRTSLIRLENSPLRPDLAFKEKGLDTYRRQALSTLPGGSTDAQIAEEHADPLPIFHWKSYEIVIAYNFFGESYRRSILFLDLDAREQLVVTTLATAAEYDHVHGIAMDLLRSWEPLPAE